MEAIRNSTTAVQEEAYRLRMSYEQYLRWADEDVHAEWVDGEVIVFMPPKTRHQEIVSFLNSLLNFYARFFQLGSVFTAPFEMRLSPAGPSREPDILFVARHNLTRLTAERLEGPADLVVEVVSEDSLRRDREQKFAEYQSFGVREYWLVDSRTAQGGLEAYALNEAGVYQPLPVEEDVIRSVVLKGFWVRVQWLTAQEMPDPLMAFAEVVQLPAETLEQLRRLSERGAQG